MCTVLVNFQAAWFVSALTAASKRVLSFCWSPALLLCIPKISRRITGLTSLSQMEDSEMCFLPMSEELPVCECTLWGPHGRLI